VNAELDATSPNPFVRDNEPEIRLELAGDPRECRAGGSLFSEVGGGVAVEEGV